MDLSLPSPIVVLLIGASGAGKSTLAARLVAANPEFTVLSYDREQGDGRTCAQAAVARVHHVFADRCARQLPTIMDGTHRQHDRRETVGSSPPSTSCLCSP